jgi:hypothetical protein
MSISLIRDRANTSVHVSFSTRTLAGHLRGDQALQEMAHEAYLCVPNKSQLAFSQLNVTPSVRVLIFVPALFARCDSDC